MEQKFALGQKVRSTLTSKVGVVIGGAYITRMYLCDAHGQPYLAEVNQWYYDVKFGDGSNSSYIPHIPESVLEAL